MSTPAFPDHLFLDPQFFSSDSSEEPDDSSRSRSMTQPPLYSPTGTSYTAPVYPPSFDTSQQQSLAAPYTYYGQPQDHFAISSTPHNDSNYHSFDPFYLMDAVDHSDYQHYIHRPLPEPNDIPGAMSTCHNNSGPRPQTHAHSYHSHTDEFFTSLGPPCHLQDNFPVSNGPNFGQGFQHLGQASPQVEFSSATPRPPTPVQTLDLCTRSQVPDFEVVWENPSSPCATSLKHARSDEEVERQKKDCRELKEIGGACLWCYRVKKKCDTESPCSRCKTHGWGCIRVYMHLSLHIPSGDHSPGEITGSVTGLFFEQAKTAFAHLRKSIAQKPENMRITITLRQPFTEHFEYWIADISEISMTKLNAPSNLHKQQLVSKALKHIHHPKLDSLAKEYSNYELVQSAVHLFKLTVVIRCFVKTKIYVHSINIDHGRLTVLYMLIAYMQVLCEKSQEFCSKLWDHLHVKDPKDKGNCANSHPSWNTSFNPVWVAAALYLRVVRGLQDLKTSPPMSEAFAALEPHLARIRQDLTQILDCVPVKHCSKNKQERRAAFKNDILVVTESNYFDIAFRRNRENEAFTPFALNRQALLYSIDPYDMESFMDSRFKDPDFIPDVFPGATSPLEITESFQESAQGTTAAIREISDSERATMGDDASIIPEASSSQVPTLTTEFDTSDTEMETMSSDINYFHEGTWYLQHDQGSMLVETDEFWSSSAMESIHENLY